MRIVRLLLFALLLSASAEPVAAFSDVPPGTLYAEAIAYAQEQNFVSGYSDGTYRPNNRINRAEFVKIVTLHAFGQKSIDMCGTRLQFTDLLYDAWYQKYICSAKDSHLIDGYPDGTFKPERSINFAEAAKIIAMSDTKIWGDPRLPENREGPWYDVFVRYFSLRDAIPPTIRSYDQFITRGEMAEMIWRLRADRVSHITQSYHNTRDGYSFDLPVDWFVEEDSSVMTPSYEMKGISFFYPFHKYARNTNLAEAKIHIAFQEDCPMHVGETTVISIHGTAFDHSLWSEGAAGSFYEGETFTSEVKGRCVVVTLFLHSTNLMNYDPGLGFTEFDRDSVLRDLHSVMDSLQV